MKAFILAAGRGTRISRFLSGKPKCTVDIGGTPLIRYTVEMLIRNGIRDIGISVGYRADAIREVLDGLPVRYFVNPFYDVTNSIASAWFAEEFLRGDDMIIMNGDVYMEEALLKRILGEEKSPVMFADETRKETADYKFFTENGLLVKYGKELAGDEISSEYIGIGRFSAEFMENEFLPRMMELIGTQKHDVWWENVVYGMCGTRPVYVEDVDGQFWAEVDYIEDYERILAHRGVERRVRP